MKINPPKVIVSEKEPFKEALFGREEFAKSLTSLLQNVSESLVVFVNAPWGAGKTTFSGMWRAYLKQQKHEVIYFDAYAADYFDDPFVSFSGEILGLVDKHISDGKGLVERREFKNTAVEVGKRLAGLAAKIGLRAATLGAVESAHIEDLKGIASELASGVSDIGADVIEKKIENYVEEKDALKSFKNSLEKLAAKVREEQGFPLTIIVDELDRCRPDFALGLLERIKHLFNVEGVAFVLLVNRSQIESYIRAVYGNVDAEAYLLKFGSLFIELPDRQPLYSYQYEPGRTEFCHQLSSFYGISGKIPDGQYLVTCSAIFSIHFDLTLREIEKTYTIMTLYYSSVPENQRANPLLVSLLSVLKIKRHNLYKSLGSRNVSATEFFTQTRLREMKTDNQHFSLDWANDELEHCLLSDAEIQKLPADGQAKIRQHANQWTRISRTDIIPTLCRRIDRFSLVPQS